MAGPLLPQLLLLLLALPLLLGAQGRLEPRVGVLTGRPLRAGSPAAPGLPVPLLLLPLAVQLPLGCPSLCYSGGWQWI